MRFVYFFGNGYAEGDASMRDILGGKGANLHEMTRIGIPVPPGFTISTEACLRYLKEGTLKEDLVEEIVAGVRKVEEATGKSFGSLKNPLLFSVRSGARVSMPGMMDTILNVGLNNDTVRALAESTSNERFAYDSYRRLIQMFGDVVFGIPHSEFEKAIEQVKGERGVESDIELTVYDLKKLIGLFGDIYEKYGVVFPQDPWEQLFTAVEAVFKSWNNERAKVYRRIHNIPDDWGTACNVQTMVFGNMGEDSCTGVCFTRNPATGEKGLFGEFLVNAQGEDVVAGVRTPEPIERLKEKMPEVYNELERYARILERHYRDMQDIEFTVERRKLYILQTRAGKRTVSAAIRISVEMVEEGIIDRATALLRVEPEKLDQLLHPMVDPNAVKCFLVKGLPASPGGACGRIALSSSYAQKLAEQGEKVILVRPETSPEDVGGMSVAEGVLTARGGVTSHAAVVARGMGKPCVVGAGDMVVDEENRCVKVGDVVVKEGEWITIDGTTGEVYLGKVNLVRAEPSEHFKKFMEWADRIRRLKVMANVDTPEHAKIAKELGAEGVGLCRTEHMFFGEGRINVMRDMIFADTEEKRKKVLSELLPFQKEDFKGIFSAMEGLPVTIRLLDPPLHEFMPKTEEEIEAFAKERGLSVEKVKERIQQLQEVNPMLGLRGTRLGILYPEIYEMQVRAIMEAACELVKEGHRVYPEIMVPLVFSVREMRIMRDLIDRVANEVMDEMGVRVDYRVGVMIELPRAALTADEIAKEVDFFSIGTNDLTQTTLGISRDDANRFVPLYLEKGILVEDPFVGIDEHGVGKLVEMVVKLGKSAKPSIKIGVCGEHGGHPKSIHFFHKVGLDYVSCSPFRILGARLAAAQAQALDYLSDKEV